MQNMTTNGENKVQRFIASGHDSVMTPFACGDWVSYEDYIRLKAEVEEARKGSGAGMSVMLDLNNQLVAEVERLKTLNTIDQRTIQGLQQTPEWSEIARLTAYCRELEGKVSNLDLFKSVVEKFFNSADLKNHPDAQSCYALAGKLKQLPDSILDFTEEQVRDNPAWALAVFRHKVKEMQYKRIHDLNEIGGEQEENARLKAELDNLNYHISKTFMSAKAQLNMVEENARIKAEVERLTEIIRREVDGGVDLREEAQRTVEENHKLRAEVERLNVLLEQKRREWTLGLIEYERLRKAGDAVSLCLEAYLKGKPYDGPMTIKCLDAWNAAKDGKPSV